MSPGEFDREINRLDPTAEWQNGHGEVFVICAHDRVQAILAWWREMGPSSVTMQITARPAPVVRDCAVCTYATASVGDKCRFCATGRLAGGL